YVLVVVDCLHYAPCWNLNALASALAGLIPPTPSVHRLRLGLPGDLIPFAPLAFRPRHQEQRSKSPSPLVFLPISTHFTTTPGIPLPSPAFESISIARLSPVELGAFRRDFNERLLV